MHRKDVPTGKRIVNKRVDKLESQSAQEGCTNWETYSEWKVDKLDTIWNNN